MVHSPGASRLIATARETVSAPTVKSLYWDLAIHLSSSRPFLQLARQVADIEGDIIECGVYRGRSLLRIARLLQRLNRPKTVFGLDSFDGFPQETISRGDLGPGRTMEKVRSRFRSASRTPTRLANTAAGLGLDLHVVVGFFHQTLEKVRDRKFCFVHLDCDIYQSYKICLDELYERVTPGGVILFDEYACPVWPGATEAVDEFFADKPEKPRRCEDVKRPLKPKYYVVKT